MLKVSIIPYGKVGFKKLPVIQHRKCTVLYVVFSNAKKHSVLFNYKFFNLHVV